VLLANELPATLPKDGKADTAAAIELLNQLIAVKLTKIMLYKNISCVLKIYNLSKYNTNSGVADLPKSSQAKNNSHWSKHSSNSLILQGARKEKNEQIKQLALQLLANFKVSQTFSVWSAIVMQFPQELVLPPDWQRDSSVSSTKKAEEQVNGDDSLKSTSWLMSHDKTNWMLYDILQAKHSVLLKAAEGNEDEFTKILQEPVGTILIKYLIRLYKYFHSHWFS
jgi:Lens epithelium-derived growth factor (LEDGF)